jgi:hypothetical protein
VRDPPAPRRIRSAAKARAPATAGARRRTQQKPIRLAGREAEATMSRRELAGILAAAPLAVAAGEPRAWSETAGGAAAGAPTAESVRAVFSNFKQLAGTWESKSTVGWQGRDEIAVIGRGSAVLFSFEFQAEGEQGMATVVHPDGDRLLLTHYCEAGNQPRLVLTEVADGGRTAVFEFLDGTNLPSRDVGHMDRVVFRFLDGDHFSSAWSWYAKGKLQPIEDVSYSRVGAAGPD